MSVEFLLLQSRRLQDQLQANPIIEKCSVAHTKISDRVQILVYIVPRTSTCLAQLVHTIYKISDEILTLPLSFSDILLTILPSHPYFPLENLHQQALVPLAISDGKTLMQWAEMLQLPLQKQRFSIAYGGSLYRKKDLPVTLSQALERSANQAVEKGIIYLQSDGSEVYQSYAALKETSSRILTGLDKLGLQVGDKVIVQLSENQDYLPTIWACILGGFVAIPLPVAFNYQQSSISTTLLQKVWEFCDRPLVVTSSEHVPALQAFSMKHGLEHFQIASVTSLLDDILENTRTEWHKGQPEDLAMIIFTSGSTGIPKGVQLTNQNILRYIEAFVYTLQLSDQDITFHWLPLAHAMGLVICHMRDVYLGCQQIHASPQTILSDPLTWLDCLDRYQVTCSMAPNFAFSLINEYFRAMDHGHWNLSALRRIVIAGEVIVPKTIRKFLSLLQCHGLSLKAMHPHYGMTEALAIAISSHYDLAETTGEERFVDVGEPLPNVWLRIVDDQDQIVVEGVNGHIQMKSPSMTWGYYQNLEATHDTFTSDGWLNTGDQGVLSESRLTITGRNKDVIIINGRNYSCQEIEAVVEEIAGVKANYAAACALRAENSNTDGVIIFFATEYTKDQEVWDQINEIRRHVVSSVGIHPSYLIPVEKHAIAKTALGKIQRAKLKQQFEEGAFHELLQRFAPVIHNKNVPIYPSSDLKVDVQASRARLNNKEKQTVQFTEPTNEIEQALVNIWQNVLQVEKVDINDNFFGLGGDSLLGIRMVAQARRAGVEVKPGSVFQYQTIAQLARKAILMVPTEDIIVKPEVGELPFTNGQSWQLSGAFNPHHFNEGYFIEVYHSVNPLLLRQTIKYMIEYHDALRLRFSKENSVWKQSLSTLEEVLPITWLRLSEMTEIEQKEAMRKWATHFQSSLNLCHGPVMQIAYFDCARKQADRLLWIFNHMIVDHFAVDLLLEDFQIVYQQLARGENPSLPQKTASFRQCAERLKAHAQSPELQIELEEYWLKFPWEKIRPLPVDFPEMKTEKLLASKRTFYKVWLSKEETSALVQDVITFQRPLMDVLITSLVQTITQWAGFDWLQVNVMDHGRNTLFDDIDMSRTVGYLSWGKRFLLKQSPEVSPEHALTSIQEQLATVPHKGLNFELLYYLSDHKAKLKDIPPVEIQLNHLGYANASIYNKGFFCSVSGNIGERNDTQEIDFSIPLILMTEVIKGELKMIWQYNECLYNKSTIEIIAQNYLKTLQKLIYTLTSR